jgi:hypothetical protein
MVQKLISKWFWFFWILVSLNVPQHIPKNNNNSLTYGIVNQQGFPLHLGCIWTPIQHRKQPKEDHNIFVLKAILMLPLEMPLYIKT